MPGNVPNLEQYVSQLYSGLRVFHTRALQVQVLGDIAKLPKRLPLYKLYAKRLLDCSVFHFEPF